MRTTTNDADLHTLLTELEDKHEDFRTNNFTIADDGGYAAACACLAALDVVLEIAQRTPREGIQGRFDLLRLESKRTLLACALEKYAQYNPDLPTLSVFYDLGRAAFMAPRKPKVPARN